MSPVHVHVAVF